MNPRRQDTNYLTSPGMYRTGDAEQQGKYAFNSPQPLQQPLPTPYSMNQNKLGHMNPIARESSDMNDCSLMENSMLNYHNNRRHPAQSHRPLVDPGNSFSELEEHSSQILNEDDPQANDMSATAGKGSRYRNVDMILNAGPGSSNPSCSISGASSCNLEEASPSEVAGIASRKSIASTIRISDASSSSNMGTKTTNASSSSATNTSTALFPDINEQPSSVLHFGNFTNELLLASPEQFKEFLIDSPMGLNFWQQRQTPAKTPLKFVTNNSNAGHQNHAQNSFNHMHSPLQNIDVNLMFNSASKASFSPTRKQMSLTPYGRKIVNEMGTPFTKMIQPTSSNNSALVDFHRAQKHHLQSTPTLKPSLRNDSPGSKIYGSSPTTIQLNSSGMKCSPRRDSNIDETLLHLRATPTPKLSVNNPNKFQFSSDMELPKMGSFKGGPAVTTPQVSTLGYDTSVNGQLRSSATLAHRPSYTSEKVRKPKLNRGNKAKSKSGQLMIKQRFQIIMTDTTSFNSDDGPPSSKTTKLKRSRSVMMPGESQKKKKKKPIERSTDMSNSQ